MDDAPTAKCRLRADNLELRQSFTLEGRVTDIPPAVERIMDVVRDMECASGHEFEVEVALNEALANAVVHGCRGCENKRVEVCVACDSSRGMLIVVRDPGEGFDPADLPSPIEGENVFAAHGRGVFLISQLMDEVRFERGGTEVWMRKG